MINMCVGRIMEWNKLGKVQIEVGLWECKATSALRRCSRYIAMEHPSRRAQAYDVGRRSDNK
jgi:hypothetical protein